MPHKHYILVCLNNPQHRRVVEQDPWTWVPSQALHSLMPQDALDTRPTPKQLKRYRCEDCGAAMTFQEQED